jgi:hypothetical protein
MHSASGITADASLAGDGDSIAHGDEKSAVKNTAPDKRTTRSTSDSTSIAVRLPVKPFRASINESSETGASDKNHSA